MEKKLMKDEPANFFQKAKVVKYNQELYCLIAIVTIPVFSISAMSALVMRYYFITRIINELHELRFDIPINQG
jgi:hypothetical protein